jgi:TonB family protein
VFHIRFTPRSLANVLAATGAAAIVGLGAASPARAQDSFKVIVNQANPVASLSKTKLAQYFLDRATWDDGTPVAAVDLPATSPVREVFARELLGQSVTATSAKWRTSGHGDPPPTMATDREVLAFVRLKPGAIGYIASSTETAGVKVLSIGKSDAGGSTPDVVEVGGTIPMPERITNAAPEYPLVARNGHVQGDVDLEVIIGTTGNVENVRVVKSIPQLDRAALDAVKRWRYKPTVVNGAAVSVRTRVRVSFAL